MWGATTVYFGATLALAGLALTIVPVPRDLRWQR
jgi:hypothetical protein